MQIRSIIVKCTECKKDISPSIFDLIPYPSEAVSVDCRFCGKTNRVPLLVSFVASLAGIAVAFTATIVLLAPYNPNSWLVAIAAVGGALVISGLLLTLYLRRARLPFVGSRVGR